MDIIKQTLLALFSVAGVAFLAFWAVRLKARWTGDVNEKVLQPGEHMPGTEKGFPSLIQCVIGFVTDFFDTLGIGSFATTTALFRFAKQVPDRLIPGTLNVGHTLPTIAQAIIWIQLGKVESITLVSMIASAVAGAWIGARFVASWDKRRVQLGMGFALIAIALVVTVRQVFDLDHKDAPIGLEGGKLIIGVAINFALGALMTIGIGLYAPCLVMISLLGMDPHGAFPIMMGSCALLMPLASENFIRKESYAPRAALGLTLAGIPAVLFAVYLVQDLPLYWVKWLVVGVVTYTSITMLRDGLSPRKQTS